jgi:hypothetical protein
MLLKEEYLPSQEPLRTYMELFARE